MAFTGRGGSIVWDGTNVTEINTWSYDAAPATSIEYTTFDGSFTVPGPAAARTGSFTCYAPPPTPECPAAITLVAGGTAACGSADSVEITGSAFCTGYSIEAPADGVVAFSCEFSFID